MVNIQPATPAQTQVVDVGNNLRHMVDRLAATGKSWELTVEDSQTSQKVTIRSK